jgi:translation initiation factor 1
VPVSNSRLVYSTDGGDRRRDDDERVASADRDAESGDGIVRVARATAGRRGKTVTLVRGLPARELNATASDLKRHCGSGGAVKNGAIELQGDHGEKVAARLRSQGYEVKLAGG